MSSLDSTFEELRARLRSPDALNPAKSDPLFYFVHAPEETLEVKRNCRSGLRCSVRMAGTWRWFRCLHCSGRS